MNPLHILFRAYRIFGDEVSPELESCIDEVYSTELALDYINRENLSSIPDDRRW